MIFTLLLALPNDIKLTNSQKQKCKICLVRLQIKCSFDNDQPILRTSVEFINHSFNLTEFINPLFVY